MSESRDQPLEIPVVNSDSEFTTSNNTVSDVLNQKMLSEAQNAAIVLKKLPFSSLKRDKDFRRVRNKGKAGRTSLLTLRWIAQRKPEVNIGIVASKKVGNAVVRNKIRRQLREAARRIDWPAMQAMIIVTPDAARASYAELVKALMLAIQKSGLR